MSRGFAPLYILISLAILTTALGAYLVQQSTPKPKIAINSFDDCIKAGYPVLESYPRQCKTQDGKSFTEQILTPTPTAVQTRENTINPEIRWEDSVHFDSPQGWKLMGTIFYDNKEYKVAEVFPDSNSCTQDYVKDHKVYQSEKLINNLKIVKFIDYVGLDGREGGYWYPNIYCLSEDKKKFTFIFYEMKRDSSKERLFDQIVSSFKFLTASPSGSIIAAPTCGACPKYSPPSADFCKNGKVVPGVKDSCGCQKPPTCQFPPAI